MKCLWLLLAACGPGLQVQARLLAQAPLTLDQIESVELFLVAGTTQQGDPIGCDGIAGSTPLTRPGLISRGHAFSSLQQVTLTGVVQSESLVLIAQGFDNEAGTGEPIAYACAEGITVRAGANVDVTLTFSARSPGG